MSTKPNASLTAIVSRDCPVGVIAKRGPSKQACLILWDLRRNRFDIGQWYKGTIELSDLSPSGDYLLSICSKRGATWTVLSRPPFLTAHGLWAIGDNRGGGGVFLSNRQIVLNRIGPTHVLSNIGPFKLPADSDVRLRREDDPATHYGSRNWVRVAGARWTTVPAERRDFANGFAMTGPEGLRLERTLEGATRLVSADGTLLAPLPFGTGFADFNIWGEHPGLVFSNGGRLMALAARGLKPLADAAALLEAATEIADFSSLAFEPKVAPGWALPKPSLAREGAPAWSPSLDTRPRR